MADLVGKLRRVLRFSQRSHLIPCSLRRRMLLGARIDPTALIQSDVFVGEPRNLTLHRDVFVNIGCFLDGCAQITLHEGVRVGPYVQMLTGTHTIANSVMRRDRTLSADVQRPIVIERGCWIGMGAVIMPGVTIAEGCVISAGAVVTRNTQPNGLYVNAAGADGIVCARRMRDLPVTDALTDADSVVVRMPERAFMPAMAMQG